MKKKMRDSRFEIIRIFSMILIVLCHMSINGNWKNNVGINHFKTMFFHPWGEIGVYLFVMITGYFISMRHTDLKQQIKVVKPLWIKTIFYSWIILILYIIFRFQPMSLKLIITAIFPISLNEYWFMTAFIILMLFLEPMNYLINKVSKKELLIYIIILVFFADVLPIIKWNAVLLGGPWGVGVLISAYFIAAYIHKYNVRLKSLYCLGIFLCGISLEYIGMFLSKNSNIWRFNFGIFPLVSSVGIFLFILNLKPFYNRQINFIASGVLASYLITEHPLFRYYFWRKLINIGKYQFHFNKLVLFGIVYSLIIVIVCSLIDHVYALGAYKVTNLISKRK